jgi:hypothetical protein
LLVLFPFLGCCHVVVDWFVSILENLVVFPHHAKLARPPLAY